MLGENEPADVAGALTSAVKPASLAQRVAENFVDYHVLARRDERNIERLTSALDGEPVLLVPQLDGDVHDVDGLLQIHRYLFAPDDEREQLLAEVVA
jgi:hypothetical protein